MSSPIANAFASTTYGQITAEPVPAVCYLFPETVGSTAIGKQWSESTFVFQYWPESLEDSYNVEYGQRQVFGGSHPLFQWTGGSGRDITFTARFTAEVQAIYDDGVNARALYGVSSSARYTVDCRAAMDYLRSTMLASYDGSRSGGLNALARPPRRYYLVMEGTGLGGGTNDAVLCVVRSAPITYEAWFPNGRPRIVEAAVTVSEVVQSASQDGPQIKFQGRTERENFALAHYKYRGAVDRAMG